MLDENYAMMLVKIEFIGTVFSVLTYSIRIVDVSANTSNFVIYLCVGSQWVSVLVETFPQKSISIFHDKILRGRRGNNFKTNSLGSNENFFEETKLDEIIIKNLLLIIDIDKIRGVVNINVMVN